MKTINFYLILLFFICFVLAFTSVPASAVSKYDPIDIAVINKIINYNKLDRKLDPGDGSAVKTWSGVKWDAAIPAKVIGLELPGEGMIGVLDLRGLTALRFLYCQDNNLTGINVETCTDLGFLDCTLNYMKDYDDVYGAETLYQFGGWDMQAYLFTPQKIRINKRIIFRTNAIGDSVIGMPPDRTVYEEGKLKAPAETPRRNGFVFGGWHTDSACLNVWNFNSDVITASSGDPFYLYAKWTPEPAATPSPSPQPASSPTPKLPSKLSLEPAPTQPPKPSPTPTLTLTLMPTRSPSPLPLPPLYVIELSGNGGTGGESDTAALQNGGVIVPPCEFNRPGYVFTGWNSKSDGKGDYYLPGAQIEGITDNISLYAQWAPELERENHLKYLNGYPDDTVHPDGNITRAEAAAIFYRLITSADKTDPVIASFSDVKPDDWHYQTVAYLSGAGIVSGYEDGTFKPDTPITKAEFAAMASKFDRLETDVPNVFGDVGDDHWASGYINSAVAKGWIDGAAGGVFSPDANITRAQVVTLVNRMLERKIEFSDIPPGVPAFADLTDAHWAYCDIIEASYEHEYIRKENGFEIYQIK